MLNKTALLASVFALALAAAPAAAQSAGDDGPAFELSTLAGAFLAGRAADTAHDLANAARFYSSALESDPENALLLERATILYVAVGEMDAATDYARRLIDHAPASPVARLALAVDAIIDGDMARADEHMAAVGDTPLANLTNGLLRAWTQFGAGDVEVALATVRELSGPSWYAIFKNYHSALMLDAAGRSDEAVAFAERALGADDSALRIVDAYARIAARAGDRSSAIGAVTDFSGSQPLHPIARDLLEKLRSGVTPEPIATDALAGAAEVFYGLGSAIGDDDPELPAAYLSLALHLNPDAHLARLALGDALQAADRCEEAIAHYDSVPASVSLRRNADIRIANCLERLERPEEAATVLQAVVDADATDFEAALELGNVYRRNSDFAEAADAYSRGLEHLPADATGTWRIHYFRGIAYERSKQWPKAETDLQKALELNPEQPQVLNYLGYSWVDMGENLDVALDMIRTAVDLRPRDGYIVDSLGWAFYRMDRFEDAVEELERAVQLQPEDPVINDHLGDAYWQVGRKREAVFQWSHARGLDPDEDQLSIILAKIEGGLGAEPDAATPDEPVAPTSVVVQPGDTLWSIAERLFGDGRAYVRLQAANACALTDGDAIEPGMRLNVPGETASTGDASVIVVETGDSLWSLAETHLGDGNAYGRLVDANRCLLGDGELITPGMTLTVAPAGAP